jgi:hypothetical protein
MMIQSVFSWLFSVPKTNKVDPIESKPRTASNGGNTVRDYMLDYDKLSQKEQDDADIRMFGRPHREIPVVDIDDLEIPNRKELFEDALLKLRLRHE